MRVLTRLLRSWLPIALLIALAAGSLTRLATTLPDDFWPNRDGVSTTRHGLDSATSGASTLTLTSADESAGAAQKEPAELTQQQIIQAYGKLPLSFEVNQGQAAEQVKFLARGSGYTVFLTADELVLSLSKPAADRDALNTERAILRMQLLGANPSPEVAGVDKLPGKSNYFIGNDPQKWHTNVPNYARVEYRNVYPGVNLVYYGNQRQLEYDFIVSPGADPEDIRLGFEGADRLELDSIGNLVLHTAGGQVVQLSPLIYQQIGGARQVVAGRYVLAGEGQVSFQVDSYDVDRPLYIDPVLVYSTYLGSSDNDIPYGIAVDPAGNAYVTGYTDSADNFPTTTNAYQPANASTSTTGTTQDAFVTKLDADGALVYSTYLGGTSNDTGWAIAVHPDGTAFVTGETLSNNFPVTTGAYQPDNALFGTRDAFLTKLSADGSSLIYSTYLGGTSSDVGYAVAVDIFGSAYLTGETSSSGLATNNAADETYDGGKDAFVAKLNPAGAGASDLVYFTYLGGSSEDVGYGISLDRVGNAYLTGKTASSDFALSTSPLQSTFGGGLSDAFVTKVNTNGSDLLYSTYLGGTNTDVGYSIAVDAVGNAYVTGETKSTDFTVSTRPYQSALSGVAADAFVTKLKTDGSLVYSTYLGGTGTDRGRAIAVDAAGNAYLTGETSSTAFPMVNPLDTNATFGGVLDAFVAKLSADGSTLVFSTYLGGSGSEFGYGIAVDTSSDAYLAGQTSSTDFPISTTLFTSYRGGANDAFIAKLTESLEGATATPTPGPVTIHNITVSNVENAAVTISWLTTEVTDGTVRYRLVGETEWQTAYDVRGRNTFGQTHYVNIYGLTPSTPYEYEVQSGLTVLPLVSGELTFATGPRLSLPPISPSILGRTMITNTNQTAGAAIVYVYVYVGADDSSAQSALISTLALETGEFLVPLFVRTQTLLAYFTFSTTTDSVKVEAFTGPPLAISTSYDLTVIDSLSQFGNIGDLKLYPYGSESIPTITPTFTVTSTPTPTQTSTRTGTPTSTSTNTARQPRLPPRRRPSLRRIRRRPRSL